MIVLQISHQSKNFRIAISNYQPFYFKIHLPFSIIDVDRNTHTTISFYMVLKHKNLTDKNRWTEVPSTYSVETLLLPTLCYSFFPKWYNAWSHMSYSNVSFKKRDYCEKGKWSKFFPFQSCSSYFLSLSCPPNWSRAKLVKLDICINLCTGRNQWTAARAQDYRLWS